MAKKKAILICVAAVLLLAVVIAAVAAWFFSSGVHLFWIFANVDVSEAPCFIIDPDSEAVIDRTVLTVKGFDHEFHIYEMFDAMFDVPGYTDILQDSAGMDLLSQRMDDGWRLTYSQIERTDGVLTISGQEAEISATIRFVDDHPVARIHYANIPDRRYVYAVCADSEEEALRIYHEAVRTYYEFMK